MQPQFASPQRIGSPGASPCRPASPAFSQTFRLIDEIESLLGRSRHTLPTRVRMVGSPGSTTDRPLLATLRARSSLNEPVHVVPPRATITRRLHTLRPPAPTFSPVRFGFPTDHHPRRTADEDRNRPPPESPPRTPPRTPDRASSRSSDDVVVVTPSPARASPAAVYTPPPRPVIAAAASPVRVAVRRSSGAHFQPGRVTPCLRSEVTAGERPHRARYFSTFSPSNPQYVSASHAVQSPTIRDRNLEFERLDRRFFT